MSVIDFSSLNVTSHSGLLALKYHDDGRPKTLHESKAMVWAEKVEAASGRLQRQMSILEGLYTEGLSATTQLATLSVAGGGSSERLQQAEKLLSKITSIKFYGSLIESAIGSDTEKDIKEYIKLLKAEEAVNKAKMAALNQSSEPISLIG